MAIVMATQTSWSFGDRVVHVSRPEWGAGVVTGTSAGEQDGRPCQMVTVRFDRAGIKTLSTAFATLRAATPDDAQLGAARGQIAEPEDPFLAKLRQSNSGGDPKVAMLRIADDASDPFATPLQRFDATVRLYRYSPSGRGLLDWAAVQSGLSDPLSRYNRHELESFFQQWTINRDNHLKKIALELKKADPTGLQRALAQAPPVINQTLRRLDAFR